MKISVALCTFNGEGYLREQIASILSQKRPVDEIIISDDGSTDGSISVIEKTVAEWRLTGHHHQLDVRVIRNDEPLGVTANFEQALRACTGDLIALCDQDDVWHPLKVEAQSALFARRSDLMLAATDARRIDGAGQVLAGSLLDALAVSPSERIAIADGKAFEALLRRNLITGATVMLRRGLVGVAAPFPAPWVHDEWLAIVAASYGEVALESAQLVDYRQHAGNQIGASGLTTSGRIARLTSSRSLRNARLLARAEALAERLPQLSCAAPASRLEDARAKVAHERARSRYPSARYRRILPVLREWRTGRYRKYGLGSQDVLRDLVQPS